ncbi:hypothetical protein [Rhizobium lusitanum]|uniref:preATP grasp domain-containing protein n=1 Tax=Rhizobium lusitanum TaxID=293958 RepID=UPI00336A02CD
MPRILIGNVDNDAMVGAQEQMGISQKITTANAALRMLWFARPGDVLVLPSTITPEMLDYWSQLRG